MYIDNGGGDGRVIVAATETLPQTAASWRDLLDIRVASPQQIQPTAYADQASSAAAAAMADWHTIQENRIGQRNAAADAVMTWVGEASGAFSFTDQGGANTVNSVPTPRTIEV